MRYRLWVYVLPNEEKPEAAYDASTPFGAFSVGDLLHPTWRADATDPGHDYFVGDLLEVVRVERHLLGDTQASQPVFSATQDDTVLHCIERLNTSRRPAEDSPVLPWDFEYLG